MRVDITGRNLDVSPAIREFTEERLEKLERVLEGIDEAHIILVREKYRHIAEIVVKGKNLVLTGTQESEDMYTSILKALEKIEYQARKHRKKMIQGKRRVNRKAAGGNGNATAEVVEEEVLATLPDGKMMVRDENYTHKPMTAEEAALGLQDGARQFVVFRDAGSNRVGVVYRREDGHVALILPES